MLLPWLAMGAMYQIGEDAPVRLLWEAMEGAAWDYNSPLGKILTADELGKAALWIFGAMNGVYSSRKLEEACRNDIRYMWLMDGTKAETNANRYSFVWRKSVENHQARAREKAAELCDDDYSGADSERPAFRQLIQEAQQGKINIVLVITQSRFTRDMELVERYIPELETRQSPHSQNCKGLPTCVSVTPSPIMILFYLYLT